MSNPGVISLVRKVIGGQLLKIEDNIGESIHIHFGDNLRLDLSIAEFMDFTNRMADALNRMIDIPGVNVRNLCPIYLNEQLREFADLERVEVDQVRLGRLLTEFVDEDGRKYLGPIADSRISKALRDGDTRELLQREQCNLRGETNLRRADAIFASIRDNGYPYKNRYIILHNSGYYIRDGLHRASCLLHLLGDVDVPVLRLHFREDRHSDEMMAYGFILEHVNRMGLGADGSEPRRLPRPLAECWKDALNGFLRGRKVAVKEPDDIALSLLTLLDRDIDIRCIIAKDAGQARLFGADVIVDADIDNHDVDTILVASAAFHREMCAELRDSNRQRGGRCRILDMYAV